MEFSLLQSSYFSRPFISFLRVCGNAHVCVRGRVCVPVIFAKHCTTRHRGYYNILPPPHLYLFTPSRRSPRYGYRRRTRLSARNGFVDLGRHRCTYVQATRHYYNSNTKVPRPPSSGALLYVICAHHQCPCPLSGAACRLDSGNRFYHNIIVQSNKGVSSEKFPPS